MSDGTSVAIALERVTKRFGKTAAVDDVSLSIGDGEFFSLLGPSGCGKTTTLRMIAGFEQPDEGRIVLQGQDVTTVPPNRRPLNMVFQHYALFPHMSVYDNVAFGLKVSSASRAPSTATASSVSCRSSSSRGWRSAASASSPAGSSSGSRSRGRS